MRTAIVHLGLLFIMAAARPGPQTLNWNVLQKSFFNGSHKPNSTLKLQPNCQEENDSP